MAANIVFDPMNFITKVNAFATAVEELWGHVGPALKWEALKLRNIVASLRGSMSPWRFDTFEHIAVQPRNEVWVQAEFAPYRDSVARQYREYEQSLPENYREYLHPATHNDLRAIRKSDWSFFKHASLNATPYMLRDQNSFYWYWWQQPEEHETLHLHYHYPLTLPGTAHLRAVLEQSNNEGQISIFYATRLSHGVPVTIALDKNKQEQHHSSLSKILTAVNARSWQRSDRDLHYVQPPRRDQVVKIDFVGSIRVPILITV